MHLKRNSIDECFWHCILRFMYHCRGFKITNIHLWLFTRLLNEIENKNLLFIHKANEDNAGNVIWVVGIWLNDLTVCLSVYNATKYWRCTRPPNIFISTYGSFRPYFNLLLIKLWSLCDLCIRISGMAWLKDLYFRRTLLNIFSIGCVFLRRIGTPCGLCNTGENIQSWMTNFGH